MTMLKLLLCSLFAVTFASPFTIIQHESEVESGINKDICSKGPIHWCQNLRTAKECRAVKHCIQTVWGHMRVPQDDDDICQICKKGVAEVRAELEKNETQDELRQIFEGSCRLIPIKEVVKECIKLADEYVPEMVEMIVAQLNPDTVCSVAGLCNSERIDKLLAKHKLLVAASLDSSTKDRKLDCDGCHQVVNALEHNFHTKTRKEILEGMLEVCGRFGSLSDGCAAVIISYFDKIYDHLNKNLKPDEVCTLTALCITGNHNSTAKVEVVHESSVGYVYPSKEDLPCEFCEQMVVHLRTMLVANTTELEFKQVLEGLCRQTGSFQSECLGLVDEYYSEIYNFLVDELNPEDLCTAVGICQPKSEIKKGPIAPLVPVHLAKKILASVMKPAEVVVEEGKASSKVLFPATEIRAAERLAGDDEAKSYNKMFPATLILDAERMTGDDEAKSYNKVFPATLILSAERLTGDDEASSYKHKPEARVKVAKSGVGVRVITQKPEVMQLPVERLMPQTIVISGNKMECEFCQYALHYMQQVLTAPYTEAEIKKEVDFMCAHLPISVSDQCKQFVDLYAGAFVALLAQEIDPSQVCPQLGLCPGEAVKLMSTINDKPGCALCLYAVEELEDTLKDNKTEERIKNALDALCGKLPKSLVEECDDFVDQYSQQLIEMLTKDVKPEDVCAYLKLCSNTSTDEILSNEIPPLPVEVMQLPETRLIPQTFVHREVEKLKHLKDSPQCVICEFVMSQLDNSLKDNATEEEIIHAVHDVCNWLPRTVSKECNSFVNQYADAVIQLLVQAMEPQEICTALHLCAPEKKGGETEKCTVCRTVVSAVDKLLKESKTEEDIDKILEKVCSILPSSFGKQCKEMVDQYGAAIMVMVAEVADVDTVCAELSLCPKSAGTVHLLGGKKCTWGPSYWCQTEFHAKACKATQHCEEKVWTKEKKSEN